MKKRIWIGLALMLCVVGMVGGLTLNAAEATPNVEQQGGGQHPPPPGRDGRPGGRDGRNGGGQNGGNNGGNNGATDSGQANAGADAAPAASAPSAALPLAGDLTVADASLEAFTNPLPGYDEAWFADFEAGDELFEVAFIPATGDPAVTDDGLGPFFNATSCGACHVEDGRGRAPTSAHEIDSGFLVRTALNMRDAAGLVMAHSVYGGQLQDFAVPGLNPEGWVEISYTEMPGSFADGTPFSLRVPTYSFSGLAYGDFGAGITFSPRVANHMTGLGLLEAVPESTILAWADPDDLNGDGISGRPNYVLNVATRTFDLGRFGWKANQPNLRQQTAGAFNGDMGITTSLFPEESCTGAQADCLAAAGGESPEISDEVVRLVTLYSSGLAVPAQRNPDDPAVQAGERHFMAAGCADCHISEMVTGTNPLVPQINGQTIRPFTDLLLHDMGPGLADGQEDFMATGSEWRTAPLWGIGLFETVNGHTTYLHDGRARDVLEAVLWHGGEAQASRDAVIQLSAQERAELVAFLKSL